MGKLILALILPLIIVAYWRRRPVRIFLLAALLFFLLLLLINIPLVFQYAELDHLDITIETAGLFGLALGISIRNFLMGIIPLAIFQWIMRRIFKPKLTKNELDTTFN